MATAQRDYYEVLGVPRDADEKTIKEAFRTLALKYHPDRNKEPGSEERFKEIAAAYAVLSSPEKRRAYDTRGFAGVAGFSEDDLFRHVDFGDLFSGLNFDFDGLGFGVGGGFFDRFFGRRRAGPRPGASIEVELEVPLSRVVTGGDEKVVYSHRGECPDCHGTGAKRGEKLHACASCQGTGRKTRESRRHEGGGEVVVQNVTACPECAGRGEIIEEACPACSGSGASIRKETLTVNVPVGAEDGMALRVPGHGAPSASKGGPRGDLFVVVRSAPDPRFERDGANLWRREALTVPEAVLGTQRTVAYLDGSVEVRIPPAAQPGLVMRIAGKGLPRFGGQGRGDLYVRLDVQIPERLTREQRKLYEQLLAIEKTGAR